MTSDEPADVPEQDEQQVMPPGYVPMLICHGEGYVTRKDGTVIPFTISNEDK